MLENFETFIDRLTVAKTSQQISVEVQNYLKHLGFDYFTYELISPPAGMSSMYMTSYPTEWIDRYIRNHYAVHDTIYRYLARVVRPFSWVEANQNSRLSEDEDRVTKEASAFGLRAGGTVPIHGPNGVTAQLSVACNNETWHFLELFQRHRHEVQLLATYAHERVLEINDKSVAASPVRLTAREVQVLSWAAKGKSHWDIAKILGISEPTVKEHTRNVCQKLQAMNRTHAASLAIMRGFISV